MNGSYFDPEWTAKVTVPVKRVDERWVFFYGGDVPVKEGTLGELTPGTNQLTDESFRKRVMQELTIKILDEGIELRVALSDRHTSGRRAGTWPEPHPDCVPPGTTRFERIWTGPLKKKPGELPLGAELERGSLWLNIKGLERWELLGSTVQMPSSFQPAVGISLNRSFTMLSQVYEKHPISSTTFARASSIRTTISAGTRWMACALVYGSQSNASCCTTYGRKSSRSWGGERLRCQPASNDANEGTRGGSFA